MDSVSKKVNQKITEILTNNKNVAVVGISIKPERPSNEVANYLKSAGYNIIPINPGYDEVLGIKCYPNLQKAASQTQIDTAVVFRRPEDIPSIAEEAAAAGVKAFWIQLGLVSDEAAEIALEAGLDVVMDKCMKVEHLRRGIK